MGIPNTIGILADDGFTQSNPCAVATNVSAQVDTSVKGVLSGSVCFSRPDVGNDYIGGPGDAATQIAIAATTDIRGYRPMGVFINNAVGNAFENTPGVASGRAPHVMGFGTYGSQLFETALIANSADAVNSPAGNTIGYFNGQALITSRNGFLMPRYVVGDDAALDDCDVIAMTAESFVINSNGSATVVAVLRQAPDSTHNELIFDLRI
jgi:hypothetical protein